MENDGVQPWNSTLKVRKRLQASTSLRSVSQKRRGKNKSQSEAMKKVAENSDERCSHCGLPIAYWKFSNIDHVKGKGKNPGLIDDPENMQVLCDEIDVRSYLDRHSVQPKVEKILSKHGSCHRIKHFDRKSVYDLKENLIP